MATITLLDGTVHELTPPTWFAYDYMTEHGIDLFSEEGVELGARHIPILLGALLTDSEPTNAAGEPSKVWSPKAVAKLIDPANAVELLAVVGELMVAARPDATGGDTDTRPTNGQAEGAKQ